LARMGEDRFAREGGATEIHRDGCGVLYRLGDETLAVRVANSTPEPDGTRKPYWLYVHPECRPMRGGGTLGDPQPLTATAAVASTFGLTADQYRPSCET